ncbi:hypothetical protein UUU_14140 [Klebsiella pneumoniae subsp. pneumoniae DSM 30104 = JCM 1662 = NBRC 14940]|nr:hypothetical protein UUU_14140 [Klebsiella pneumoniae subsp. pneumoniae DSM 30104 = JCM 1662 = NBRC 14940]
MRNGTNMPIPLNVKHRQRMQKQVIFMIVIIITMLRNTSEMCRE